MTTNLTAGRKPVRSDFEIVKKFKDNLLLIVEPYFL